MGQGDGVFGEGQTLVDVEKPRLVTNLPENFEGVASSKRTQMFFERSGEIAGGFVENGGPSLLTGQTARGLLP